MRETDIAFPTDDGLVLAGTLTEPVRGEAFPATLLVNGSGPLDRDSTTPELALGIAPALAGSLVAKGVASLRFDKRGVGRSAGEYLTTGFERETDDADAALRALGERARIDRRRITVIGHSVGAVVAIRLATRHELAGIVLIAGTVLSGADVMRQQSERIAESFGVVQRLFARRFLKRQRELRDALRESDGDVLDVEGGLPARWFREYMTYNPAANLPEVRCPVLAVTGRKDLQVDPDDVERMGALVAGPFTGSTPDDLTHVLRTDPGRPSLSTYGRQAREPVDAALVEQVTSWIASR